MTQTNPELDLKAVAARVLRYLAREQSRGRLVRLDELAGEVKVRRGDVRKVIASLDAEGHVDAQRLRLTLTGLALAAAMRTSTLRKPRRSKRQKQSLVA